MLVKIFDINESYCGIQTDNQDIIVKIADWCSCFVEGSQYTPRFKAGMWDGKRKFYRYDNSTNTLYIPKGLSYTIVEQLLLIENIELVDERVIVNNEPISEEDLTIFINSLNLPFTPYDYQFKAVLDSINEMRLGIKSATGSGKSIIIYILCRYFVQNNIKAVVIVPNISLVEQLYSDFKDYNFTEIEDNVRRIGGDNKVKSFDMPITISTYQSLYRSPELFKDIGAILVDEFHMIDAGSFTDIILPSAVNAKYRLGCSGSIPKSQEFRMAAIGLLGPVKTYITAKQLIDRGLATDVLIHSIILKYSEEESIGICKLKKYQDEVKFILNHEKRNDYTARFINKLSQKGGNTVVLFDRISLGQELLKRVVKIKFNEDVTDYKLYQLPDNKHKIFLITGDLKKASVREEIRKKLENIDGAIIFGTYPILSTGVNVKNLKYLVLGSSTKSETRIPQSIGRLMRLHKSKDKVTIFDIVDDLTYYKSKKSKNLVKNRVFKHWEERLSLYLEYEFNLSETNVVLK